MRKNVREKSNDEYSSIDDINAKEIIFFSERELKSALRDTLTQAAWYGLLSTMVN